MAARKFLPSLHPRDKNGRFTRSRSAQATPAEKKQAAAVATGLKPKKGVTGAKAGDYLRGIGGDEHREAVSAYTSGGHEQTHKALRAGKVDEPSVKAMDAAMVDLPDDLVVSRRVPLTAFGSRNLDDLVGLKVKDAAYSPTGIGAVRATKTDVRMRIAVPAGTRAAVDPDTGEVVLDRDLEMVVARVEPNTAGGQDMFLTVLPKAASKVDSPAPSSTKPDAKSRSESEPAQEYAGRRRAPDDTPKSAPTSKASPKKAQPAAEDKPEGGEQVRADLMKLKVPELQAQMRERGLKPGKLRKSQLVDALVADETGDESASPPSLAEPPAPQLSFSDRIAAAATGEDALSLAPLSLTRAETHDRLGHRGGLTIASRDALLDYRGAAYASINGTLRDADTPQGRHPSDPERDRRIDTQIAGVDAAIDGSPLKADVVAWRGVRRAQKMFGDRFDQNMTGLVWKESAYVSTSASRAAADQFASPDGGTRMRILVPAGTGAVEVSSWVDEQGFIDEAELLLKRGVSMRVVADHGFAGDGIRDLDVEVLT